MTATKRLGTLFIARKSGTDLETHFSDNLRTVVKPAYRSTGHWTFVVGTFPWTRFQTRGTSSGARSWTLVVDATLAAGFLALAVTPLVLRVTRTSTKVLAVQRALARVLCVFNAFDWSRSNLIDVQVQLLTLSTSSLALFGTAVHRSVTWFGTDDGGRVLMANNRFRMFAVWQILLDHFVTLYGRQVLEQVAGCDEDPYL